MISGHWKFLFILLMLSFAQIEFAYGLCVRSNTANLRAGPGTEFATTWQVQKYMPLKKIKKNKDWYKVGDLDGDEHWIFSKIVTETFKCAVIKVKLANIRSGPGKNFKKIHSFAKYTAFKVIETKGDWLRLEDERKESYWLFSPLAWVN